MEMIISLSAPKTLQEQANEDRAREALMLEHGPDGLEEAAEQEEKKEEERKKEQERLDADHRDKLTTLGKPSADAEKSGAEIQDEHDQLDKQKL